MGRGTRTKRISRERILRRQNSHGHLSTQDLDRELKNLNYITTAIAGAVLTATIAATELPPVSNYPPKPRYEMEAIPQKVIVEETQRHSRALNDFKQTSPATLQQRVRNYFMNHRFEDLSQDELCKKIEAYHFLATESSEGSERRELCKESFLVLQKQFQKKYGLTKIASREIVNSGGFYNVWARGEA